MSTTLEGAGLALPRSAAAGDPAEATEVDLAQMVRLHAAMLYRVAYSVVRHASEAEDVVQDTFVRVLEHKRRLPEVRDRRVWLVRIAWNLALDRKRRRKPHDGEDQVLGQLMAREQPADAAIDDARRVSAVLRAIDALPRLERQALLLAGIDELTTAEIAGVIGRSESAVRAVLFRARKRLKERLKKGGYA